MLAQIQSQRQCFKILPQQIHLLNLFFLNSLELQQRIKNELEENPFLDVKEESTEEAYETKLSKDAEQDFQSSEENAYEDKPDHMTEYQNYFGEAATMNSQIAAITNFREDAKQQLQLLHISKKDKAIAEYIIDILTPRGIMDTPLEKVSDDISFQFRIIVEVDAVKKGLKIVQSLDPVGIGTTSIKDCLLSQLRGMDAGRRDVQRAIVLLEHHYDELMLRKFDKLYHILRMDEKEMKIVLALIGNLNFYPVNEISQHDPKQTIIPDFIVRMYGDDIQVTLRSGNAGTPFVNQTLYDDLARHIKCKDKSAGQYVKTKLAGAQWFVHAVKQRERTMMQIMQCIVEMQHDYFVTGDVQDLRPMVLRNISDKTGIDIATISRITGNKYADTPFGLIFIKKLFSEGIADSVGKVISNKAIQSMLHDTIDSENKENPYTDQQLVGLLSLKGVILARRTVTKYRDQLRLPTAQIRAVWA
jgi:RNA polymerase sigma-54 factor